MLWPWAGESRLDSWQLPVLILLGGLFLLIRSRGPSAGLMLTDVLVLGAIGYTGGARIVCSAHRSICVSSIIELADLVAISTLLAGILISLMVAARPELLGHLHTWIDLPRRCRWGRSEQRVQCALVITSAAVSAAFLYLIHTVSGAGLVSLLTGETSLLGIRKGIVSGTYGYLAPGYLKQIRDVLFPIVAGTFVMFGIPRRYRVIFGISTAIVIAAMVVSGQRAPLLLLLAVTGASFYSSYRHSFSGRIALMILSVAAAAGLFLFSTALLGRSGDERTPSEEILALPIDIAERLFARTPYENMATADFWWDTGPTLGRVWLQDFAAILPGTQDMMSTRLHLELGGSAAGNSVLGLPADVYVSWGWPGALILPWIYMFGALAIDRYCILSRSAFSKPLKIYLTFAALQWFSPYLFILNGGLILLVVVSLDYLRRSALRRV